MKCPFLIILWSFVFFITSLSSLYSVPLKTPLYHEARASEISLGNPLAPLKVICYSSFTCLHCADYYCESFPLLKKKYIDQGHVFYIMRDYPLDPISLKAAQLAHSQGEGSYIKNAKIFYGRQKEWLFSSDPEKGLRRIAKICGISEEEVEKALEDETLMKKILNERLKAQKQLGVLYTPTFIINGRKIEGYMPFEKLEQFLEEATSQKKGFKT